MNVLRLPNLIVVICGLCLAAFTFIMSGSLLLQILIFAAAAAGVLISFRKPEWLLLAYTVLILFEDVLKVTGVGTLTKGVGFLFAICYAVTFFKKISLRAIPLPLWYFLGWSAISMLWTINATMSLSYMYMIMQQCIMMLFIADYISRNVSRMMTILWSYTLASSATSVLAIINYLNEAGSSVPDRVNAFDDQSVAHFAAACIPGLLFCSYQLLSSSSWRIRLLLIPLFSVQMAAILVSGTRSAWFGICAALLFMVVPYLKPKKLPLIALFMLIMYLVILLVPHLQDFILMRYEEAASTGGAGRTEIWKVGLTIWREHPFLGIGINNFPSAFTWEAINKTHDSTEYAGALFEGRAPHNIYLSSAVETGIIGVALLLTSLWSLIRPLIGRMYGPLITGLIMAYVVEGFFLDIMNRKYFWFVIALACGLIYSHRRKDSLKEVR